MIQRRNKGRSMWSLGVRCSSVTLGFRAMRGLDRCSSQQIRRLSFRLRRHLQRQRPSDCFPQCLAEGEGIAVRSYEVAEDNGDVELWLGSFDSWGDDYGFLLRRILEVPKWRRLVGRSNARDESQGNGRGKLTNPEGENEIVYRSANLSSYFSPSASLRSPFQYLALHEPVFLPISWPLVIEPQAHV